jgi:hypothetical protein
LSFFTLIFLLLDHCLSYHSIKQLWNDLFQLKAFIRQWQKLKEEDRCQGKGECVNNLMMTNWMEGVG